MIWAGFVIVVGALVYASGVRSMIHATTATVHWERVNRFVGGALISGVGVMLLGMAGLLSL